jgi:mRNA interferase RelE/StbE
MWTVELSKDAVKSFNKLDRKLQSRIKNIFGLLEISPFPAKLDIKKLQGIDNYYRIRVGKIRIIYQVVEKEILIIVFKIGKRENVYSKY